MTSFGLSNSGFVPMQQQDIISAIQTSLQATFGASINLAPTSIFGQIVGIVSEREALLWQLLEAIYNNASAVGAEGTAVDNLLGLTGLVRLAATSSVTEPTPTIQTNGIPLYGLVLYGTPGTVIPAGSTVSTSGTPALSFALDRSVTIAAPSNGAQSLVLSNAPTTGLYALSIAAPSGATQPLTTPTISYAAQDTKTTLTWAVAPTSGTFVVALNGQRTTALAYNVSAASLESAIRSLTGYSATAVTAISGGFQIAWPGAAFNPVLCVNSQTVTFVSTPSSGAFTLQLDAQVSTSLAYNASPAVVQAAINALTGFSGAIVGAITNGYVINWMYSTPPASLTLPTNTTGVSATVAATYSLNQAAVVTNSIQAAINNLHDSPVTNPYPYSDVSVTASGSTVFLIAFGANAPLSGSSGSANQPQPEMVVNTNTLQNVVGMVTTTTNATLTQSAVGSLAQGVGSATCTVTGPNPASAGSLTVISSPLSGWAGVVNQLDVIAGSNTETDTQAMVRRSALFASHASGPLQAIVEQVLAVPDVTGVSGYANTTDAAIQVLSFSSVPTTGTYQLVFGSGVTAAINATDSAATIQTKVQAVPGLNSALMTGNTLYGLSIDFNGSLGNQAEVLAAVTANSTSVTITPSYGRPAKSFEIVVQGGSDAAVAEAIYQSAPAGIASYGSPVATTLASTTVGSAIITVTSAAGIVAGLGVFGAGIDTSTTVASVSGTAVTLNKMALATNTSAPLTFKYAPALVDAFGNPLTIAFSRPVPILIYVNVNLLTDIDKTPGVPSSGLNPASKFNPATVSLIQNDIVAIGNAVGIGGLIVSMGTNGLVGAFNSIAGVIDFGIAFNITMPSPPTLGTASGNIQMLSTQLALFEQANVAVSYT